VGGGFFSRALAATGEQEPRGLAVSLRKIKFGFEEIFLQNEIRSQGMADGFWRTEPKNGSCRGGPVKKKTTRVPKQAPLPAKLTRPRANELVPRERVFALLNRPDVRWTWITAPAGAGKTSLASSWIDSTRRACLWYQIDAGDADAASFFHYLILQASRLGRKRVHLAPLTPEFLPGLDVYARRFFERLFGKYGQAFVVVLDNLHELPADAPVVSTVLCELIESLPAHGSLLCLSRQSVPPALGRLTTRPGFQHLGWEDLSLTEREAIALGRLVGHAKPDAVADCNRRMRGWVAGVKLVLQAPPEQMCRLVSPGDVAVQGLFDYYAGEVFERASPERREFLLQAAVLRDLDADTVAALTHREDAAVVLAKLFAERLFIERRVLPNGPSYQFHPLFHDFLLTRLAASRTPSDIAAMKTRAAETLEKRGLLESATVIALECDDTDLLVRLILAQAQQMVAWGRMITLETWLAAVPEPIRESDGWLLYWQGFSCSVRDIRLGREILERAYHRFQSVADAPGVWLSVSSIIHNHFMAWGSVPDAVVWQWVDIFETMRARHGGSIPDTVEPQVFAVLAQFASHCPEHALSRHLAERALVMIRHTNDPEQRMAIGAVAVGSLIWRGDEAAAWLLLERLTPPQGSEPRTTIATHILDHWRTVLLWTRSEHERCFAFATAARARYREAGLGVLDYLFLAHLVLAALSAGDNALAQRLMQECLATIHPFQVVMLQTSQGCQAMQLSLAGKTAAGAHLARKLTAAGSLATSPSTAAMERSFLVVALLEAGALDEAAHCAAQALEAARRLPSDRWLFDAHLLFAGIELEQGAEEPLLANLRQALALGAARDFLGGVSLFQPSRAARLLGIALNHGIESEYVKRLIRHRRIPAPLDLDSGARWPVRLRVRTLGQFALWIDERPQDRAPQATRKPLEVLKALIGLGPTAVGLATLGATLWPELDGAAAHNACHVAIHRLRKILGDESAIRITQGMVALNDKDAWIDVEFFRRVASRIRMALAPGASRPDLDRLAEQLLTAYPGHFLPEEDRSWVIGVREQLRARFVHLAIDLARALERSGAAEAAIALNRHCIALDPLTESFHRGLIQGLIALGRKAEALEAFRHCRAVLRAGLGVEPSRETHALHARILQP
jgi:DNA-binding SARP family transcriptional activator